MWIWTPLSLIQCVAPVCLTQQRLFWSGKQHPSVSLQKLVILSKAQLRTDMISHNTIRVLSWYVFSCPFWGMLQSGWFQCPVYIYSQVYRHITLCGCSGQIQALRVDLGFKSRYIPGSCFAFLLFFYFSLNHHINEWIWSSAEENCWQIEAAWANIWSNL